MSDIRVGVKSSSTLQARETRPAARVQADYLTVDDAALNRKRSNRARHFGEDRGVVIAVARQQERFAADLARQQAVPVELELEDPPVAGEGLVGGLGQHRLDLPR